ncbi:Hypothetical protein A7982_01301 [Minicystis rosea]|nr:Hypothetical protein A7982_01301 [Minicystis rosea]
MDMEHRGSKFSVIDRGTVLSSWDGQPTTILPNQNVNMAPTTNGSLVLAYQNMSAQNNQGNISLTSGGGAPQFLEVPALANQPSILIQNWHANNLSITNISPTGTQIPIWLEALGPGLPGLVPMKLPTDGTAVRLVTGQAAQGTALPQYMNLVLASQTSQLTILAIVGGKADQDGNNAYVIALNATANTGPGGATPPSGYYATTTGNQYAFQLNWGSSTVFVADFSPSTASAASVSFYPL